MKFWLLLSLSLLSSTLLAAEKITFNPIFSEGAVLQRDQAIAIFGMATSDNLPVEVSLQNQTVKTVTKDKVWRVVLKPLTAGGPFKLTLNKSEVKNIYVGDVWVAGGQSNMWWPLKDTAFGVQDIRNQKDDPYIRFFSVKIGAWNFPNMDGSTPASWIGASKATVPYFSAVSYYFASNLRKKLNIPIGILAVSVGGSPVESWIAKTYYSEHKEISYILERQKKAEENYPAVLNQYNEDVRTYPSRVQIAQRDQLPIPPKPIKPEDPKHDYYRPSALYNYMVAPWEGFVSKGIIWYQGESNAGRYSEYFLLFSSLIHEWRDHFSLKEAPQVLPFLFVQLSSYGKKSIVPQTSDWANLREVQRQVSLKEPKTAMVISSDYGMEFDIHPKQKKPVGDRLSAAAFNLVYGDSESYFTGPVVKKVEYLDDSVLLTFDNFKNSLKSCNDEDLKQFELKGKGTEYELANAMIINSAQIKVTPRRNSKIVDPTNVRMGWYDFVETNLCSDTNMMASSFGL